jgi:streptomycin 6-kinase
MRIPDDLPRRWRTYWPDADVERMARDVEARIDDAIAAWALTDAHPLPGGHVGAVLATADLVLKVSPRGHDDDVLVASQPEALEHWRPSGIVPVLHGRRDDGFTYLMQRMRPGTTLDDAGLGFEDRLHTLGVLAARLHAAGPAPAGFVPLADYAARWNPGALAAPRDDDVLLHADLHGGNVLRDGDGWKVVDPHAARGDRHADVWALLDPLVPAVPDDATALRWVAVYAEAARLDPDRARAWVHVRAAGEADDVEPDDPGWAARLRRMAEATSPAS